ncbi:transcription factor Adf-1-like [Rhagoletis pomonella]|uniref:transcription factor Adf-1-like n=1 Tax=Rhagoletis pomonella TaxID=28610 RepID=UPI0017828369|nr:transcription factor Adf-1-like [Rhagoletis pomonella]
MDFEEKLIEEIRKQPILYNLGLNDYKNLRKKDSAWKEVASAMKCDEVQYKKRWKDLGDCYKRIKRSQQLASGSGAPSPKRKRRYMEAVSFLDEVQSSRSWKCERN